jgi:hypothetical protein
MKKIDVLEKLIDRVKVEHISGSPPQDVLRKYHREGTEIPKQYLPGYLMSQLSPEERAELSKLTSDDTINRRQD